MSYCLNDTINLESIYSEIMNKLWYFPRNDQKPFILSWFSGENFTKDKILDIGSGDAYYLGNICPTRYDFIEPNPNLKLEAIKRLNTLNLPYSCIKSIHCLTEKNITQYDIINI